MEFDTVNNSEFYTDILCHIMESTFIPRLFLHCRPFSCLRRTWWNEGKQDVWRGRVTGNQLTEVHLEGWSVELMCFLLYSFH